ncbi:MAG: efflux transporter outer membrane subunit [Asticcacaulis sp.]
MKMSGPLRTPRPLKAAFAVSLLALSLTACSTVPQSAPFGREPSAAKNVNPIADVSVQGDWWTGLGDTQLNDLMSKALSSSPDLAAAAGRLYKADAMVGQARSSGWPQLSFLGGALALGSDASGPSLKSVELGGLNFSYEFDFWGKNRAAVIAASSSASAVAADAAQARLVLTTALATAYIDLARLNDERDLAVRAVKLKQENLDLVTSRHSAGLVSDAEVQLAQAGVYNAQGDLDAFDEQIALGRNRIAAIAGLDPDFAATIQRPALKLPSSVALPEKIDLNLIGRRPDVTAARWRAEAASQQIKQAHAAYYPNINLMAFAGRLALGAPLDMGQNMTSIGPAITLPIFEGGRLNANLKSAEGEHAIAIATYNGTVVNAMHEAADAVVSERALGDRLKQGTAALNASENAYNLVRSRYQGGLTDYATLLLAEQTVINQRRAVADLQSRALSLDVALIKAVGGQYTESPVTTISN